MKVAPLAVILALATLPVAAQEVETYTPDPITFYVTDAPTAGSIPNARYVTPQATYQTNSFGTPTTVVVNPIYQHTHKIQLQPTQNGLPTYQVPRFQTPNSTYTSGVPTTIWQSNNSGVVTNVQTEGLAQWQFIPVVVPTTSGTTQTDGVLVLPGALQPNP